MDELAAKCTKHSMSDTEEILKYADSMREQSIATKYPYKPRWEVTANAVRVLIFSSIFLLGEGVFAAGGGRLSPNHFGLDELWLDQFDLAGGNDDIDAMAEDLKRVYVAGEPMNVNGNEDIVVRALNAQTGKQVWRRQFNLADLNDDVRDITVNRGKVFMAGTLERNVGNRDAIVAALNANTGKVLWKYLLEGVTDDKFIAIAAKPKRVYVVGEVDTARAGEDFLVAALDSHKGQVLWRKQFDLNGAGLDDDARNIVVQGNKIFVSGRSLTAAGDRDGVVRALDANTGEVLWEYLLALGEGSNDDPRLIAVRRNQLFVVGLSEIETAPGLFVHDAIVLALNANTGAEVWRQGQFDLAGEDDEIKAMAVQGKRVFVAGSGKTASGDRDGVVRALHVGTGEVLWEYLLDLSAGNDGIRGIVVQKNYVFVAGMGDTSAGNRDAVVGALDVETGELLWKNLFDLAMGDDSADIVMTAKGARIFVGGVSDTGPNVSVPPPDTDAVVRAFATE